MPCQTKEHQILLLICPREEVEYVKEGFHIKLREDSRRAQNWMRCLRVENRCLVGIPGNVVLWPVKKLSDVPPANLMQLTSPYLEAVVCSDSSPRAFYAPDPSLSYDAQLETS